MEKLSELASRYAAAWSSGDPILFSSFYSENGSFRINDGAPAVGREAIAKVAGGFMASFPDMLIQVVEVKVTDDHVEFHWHWTGTNTGPGGTGNAVDLNGYEQWTLGEDGQIIDSRGNMDDTEYQRQLHAKGSPDLRSVRD